MRTGKGQAGKVVEGKKSKQPVTSPAWRTAKRKAVGAQKAMVRASARPLRGAK